VLAIVSFFSFTQVHMPDASSELVNATLCLFACQTDRCHDSGDVFHSLVVSMSIAPAFYPNLIYLCSNCIKFIFFSNCYTEFDSLIFKTK